MAEVWCVDGVWLGGCDCARGMVCGWCVAGVCVDVIVDNLIRAML